MGETTRLNQRSKFRGAMVAVCAGLVTTVWACGDDSGVIPTDDGGTDGSVAMDSTAHDAPATDTTSNDARDATSNEAATNDASDARTDVSNETGANDANDAANDQSSDSTLTDAARDGSDAAPDAADAAPPSPLRMCVLFDNEYQIENDAGACATYTVVSTCPDRIGNWATDFTFNNFVAGPIGTDCRISGMFSALAGVMGGNGLNDYGIDLNNFTLALFGCPVTGMDAGTNAFGLVPTKQLPGHIFTAADLSLLSSYYVAAIQASLAAPCAGPGCSTSTVTSPLPPLTQSDGGTQGQLEQIRAMLSYLASQSPGTNPSTTAYSFDSCTTDAGNDAPSDGPGGG